MSKHYYYFAASLPSINLDGKPSRSVDEFLDECQRLMSNEDFRVIKAVLYDEPIEANNVTAKAWITFNHDLRNELAWFRAEKLRKDPSDHLRGQRVNQPSIAEKINQAYSQSNLLEGEKILDKIKWDFLTDLVVDKPFTFDFIFAYGLKLKIMNKYVEYASNKGPERFKELKEIHMSLIGQEQ